MLALQRAAGNRSVALALQRGRAGKRRPPVHPLAAPTVQRQPKASEGLEEKTGIDVEPDSAVNDLVGSKHKVPAEFTAEKRPGRGQGNWLTVPSFHLRLDPELMVVGILDRVPVHGLYLTNPTLVFNRENDRLSAAGTVSIPTEYPATFDAPTDIAVRMTSTKPELVSVQGQYGPFVADFKLKVSYDSAPLRRAIGAARRLDFASAASQVGKLPPGHADFSGSVGVGGERRKLPLNYAAGSVDVSKDRALLHGGAAGLIGLPAKTFHPELAVPALGGAYGGIRGARSGEQTHGFAFGGITGKPSIAAVSSMDFGGMLEPFAYFEVKGVHKTADGHEYSLRLFGQYDLGGESPGADLLGATRTGVDEERQKLRYPGAEEEPYDKKESVVDPAVRARWKGMEGAKPEGALQGGAELKITF